MIKIKICDTAPHGACSYYRGIGPLSKLRKINPNVQIEYIENVSWTVLTDCDILFLVRPVENAYIESIEMAKKFGVKVWIDFDDCLHEIPPDNPGFKYFRQPYILSNMEKSIKLADIVTVSTHEIKRFYQQFNPNIQIVENAFNDYNYRFDPRTNDARFISWRGSNTHRVDLQSCVNDIAAVASHFPDIEWVFIGGDNPWFVTDRIQKASSITDMEITKYNKYIWDLGPSIHIVPLIDSVFNRAKSNIAFIEATWAGAACLCPSLPEFAVPGAVNYTDNFLYLLEKLIKSRTFRMENYERAYQYVKDYLLLSTVNQKRIKIIEEVLK